MRTFESLPALRAAVGEHLGYSDWLLVDQDRVDRFAEATGDFQWIHVDRERAAQGPFRGTIAHGYLTLALIPLLTQQVFRVDGVRMAVNYGLNKVRFPAVLPVGTEVRGGVEVIEATEVDGGVQVTSRVTIEAARAPKPCCVAETVARYYA